MGDKELIETVAKIWVSSGGDATGFEMLYLKIKAMIEYLKKKEGA